MALGILVNSLLAGSIMLMGESVKVWWSKLDIGIGRVEVKLAIAIEMAVAVRLVVAV